jgi:hypothetical protein
MTVGGTDEAMFVPPIAQKKGQFRTFIHKKNLFLGRLLVSDTACPLLFEKQKIQFQRYDILTQAAVKLQHFDRGKGRGEASKKSFVKASPNLLIGLIDAGVNV